MTDVMARDTTDQTLPEQAQGATVGDMSRSADRPFVPMNALSRLIYRRKAELDLSWYDIRDRGGFSSHTVPYALARKRTHRQPPRGETLARLARALELPVDVVNAAAGEAAGYQLGETRTTLEAAEDVRVIVSVMNDLSPEGRSLLRRIAQVFREDTRTALAHSDQASEDRKRAETAKLRAELSEAADKVPGPDDPVRSIRSAKRPPRKR
jgi:hypothetical protein